MQSAQKPDPISPKCREKHNFPEATCKFLVQLTVPNLKTQKNKATLQIKCLIWHFCSEKDWNNESLQSHSEKKKVKPVTNCGNPSYSIGFLLSKLYQHNLFHEFLLLLLVFYYKSLNITIRRWSLQCFFWHWAAIDWAWYILYRWGGWDMLKLINFQPRSGKTVSQQFLLTSN